jgi:hypothetical protein
MLGALKEQGAHTPFFLFTNLQRRNIEMEPFLPFLSEFGFPVVVTLYLLHRVKKKLYELNQSIQELPTKLIQPPY